VNVNTIYIYALEVQFDVEKAKKEHTEQLEVSSLEPEKVIKKKMRLLKALQKMHIQTPPARRACDDRNQTP
jgi:hypothetical protein